MAFSLGNILTPIVSPTPTPSQSQTAGNSGEPTPTPTAANPEPAVVYTPDPESGPSDITYTPPAAPVAATPDAPSDDASATSPAIGGEAAVVAQSTRLRGQAQVLPGSDAAKPALVEPRQALSAQVAGKVQPLQAQAAAASIQPGLADAAVTTQPADQPTQAQVMAQAAYALVADASSQGNSALDLIRTG